MTQGTTHVLSAPLPPTRSVALLRRVLAPIMWRVGRTAVLNVPGRRTGAGRHVPLIPMQVDGISYLVSMHGGTDWVRNLRAAGRCELRRKSGTDAFTATEVDGSERDRVVASYLAKSPKPFRTDFNRRPDAGEHPVFRMARVTGPERHHSRTRPDGPRAVLSIR